MNVFIAMSTQWLRDMGHPTGLNYCALREVWQRLRVTVDDRDQVFEDLRVMEEEALVKMRADEAAASRKR